MAATRVSLTANAWVQVTNGEAEGLIRHQLGTKKVVYTVAESAPTGFDDLTPVVSSTSKGETLNFSTLKDGEHIFAYCIDGKAELTLAETESSASLIKSLSTGSGETSRIKTDDQPTSYEQNKQFKIFHRMIGIATTGQIVFKFSTVPPLNIIERNIAAWGGGREYLVIPDTGQYPAVDALLTTPVQVRNVNGNLEDSGLPVHPTSGVTVDYGVLTGGNQIPIADDDQFPNGDVIAVNEGGFFSVTNSQLSNSVNKSGIAAGQAFYLVFRNISSDAFEGQFFLQWEER